MPTAVDTERLVAQITALGDQVTTQIAALDNRVTVALGLIDKQGKFTNLINILLYCCLIYLGLVDRYLFFFFLDNILQFH